MGSFNALLVRQGEHRIKAEIEKITLDDLMQGEVTICVAYSSVNYKDGLAASENGRIVRQYPMIPGIDLAGTVEASEDPRYREGDQVIVTSYGLGVSHYGGFSQYARVPAAWVVPLPEGLTMKEAMIYGTAGFTAALAIHRLEENGLTPGKGPVLVTGAAGGVGSMATALLSHLGYEVTASTGRIDAYSSYLHALGAKSVLPREELQPDKIPTLGKQQWTGAVDPVGGRILAFVLSNLQYGGSVATCGLTGGGEVPATVYPFILRGVNLLGIDSVECPMALRLELWKRMAGQWKPEVLEELTQEISLHQLPAVLDSILQGQVRGRVVVRMDE